MNIDWNIDWDNKPEWAIGFGYSTKYNDWLWFDHSHYMSLEGDARFPFNTSFSKNDMTYIQLACDNQTKQHDVDWDEMPEWADGHAEVGKGHAPVWFDNNNYTYTNDPSALFSFKSDNFAFTHLRKKQYPPAKEWNGLESLPCIGEEYELKPYWHKVTIIAHHDSEEGTRIVFWDHHALVYGYSHRPDYFRTFKSDKEKWIEQTLQLDCEPSDGMLSRKDFCGAIYDAVESGKLPIPKGEKK